jgi:hypothetical protein
MNEIKGISVAGDCGSVSFEWKPVSECLRIVFTTADGSLYGLDINGGYDKILRAIFPLLSQEDFDFIYNYAKDNKSEGELF